MWREGWVIESGAKKKIDLHNELLCVWGGVNAEKPQPWSPLAKDHQRANLLLYWVGSRGPELFAYKKTEGDPISVIISKVLSKSLISVEQKVSLRGAVSIEVNVLEVTANVLKRTSVISVPLQTQISCCSLSNNEGRLLLGCIDGSVALLDRISGATQIIKSSIIPTHAIWHTYDAIAAISNEKGQLQYFDTALNRINTQFNADEGISIPLLDLSSYFNLQPNISTIKWGRCGIMVIFEHGPLAIVTHLDKGLTFASLVQQYMKTGKIKKAISLLLSWDWDEQFYAVLQFIILSLLKSPLTEESSESLQKALSCFYSPIVRLDSEIKDKYEGRILALTRRFFHQLVRYKMFETAFLLAVDIGHHDLFMDLYYCAIKMNEKEMAAAARAHASAILSRCSSEGSCCSQSSCSQCSETYTDESNESEKLQTAHEHISAFTTNSDYLTTNFNECAPNTYNESLTKKFPQPPRLLQNFNEIQAPPLPIAPTFTAQYSLPSRLIPPRPLIPKPQVSRERMWTYNPPLPPIQTAAPPAPSASQPTQQASSKKQQAKVKFSDTVTAFIVPEIKRPPRPPPPPHITNPQRELADSLPLCHPNEDYLKDFTPVRHESDDTITKPKIKVVHFGVV
ncbi:WD repeat-containing and planar cell polarity effector protein fritz isoform X2 [Photinus pyralis]|nr:WD repeat-containing and planar cell polarity effector protein fritz isoform X2 [Photinus pyralis]